VIASIDELRERALADPRMAALFARADWYLIGSRTTGHADDLSDWDTVVFCDQDEVSGTGDPSAYADALFGVERPRLTGTLNLAFHIESRLVTAVDIELMGPSTRRRRERETLAEWAYQLQHAVALCGEAGIGASYIAHVAASFAARAPVLAETAYAHFRRTRNEAVSALPRGDQLAQSLAAAACVANAARFWLLAVGEPHPTEKWLVRALQDMPGTSALLAAMKLAIDPSRGPAERFDAALELWRLVDAHARSAGVSPGLLKGSPFS
jgi:hypothetical protein